MINLDQFTPGEILQQAERICTQQAALLSIRLGTEELHDKLRRKLVAERALRQRTATLLREVLK